MVINEVDFLPEKSLRVYLEILKHKNTNTNSLTSIRVRQEEGNAKESIFLLYEQN